MSYSVTDFMELQQCGFDSHFSSEFTPLHSTNDRLLHPASGKELTVSHSTTWLVIVKSLSKARNLLINYVMNRSFGKTKTTLHAAVNIKRG